jgi:hypothetical protein
MSLYLPPFFSYFDISGLPQGHRLQLSILTTGAHREGFRKVNEKVAQTDTTALGDQRSPF